MRDPSRNTESHHRIDPNAAKYILRPKRGWERGGSEQTLRTRRSLCNGYSLEEEDAHVGRSRPNLAFHRFVYLFINSYIYTARVVEYAEIEPRRKNRDTHLGWSFAWLGSARGTQPCCPGVVVVVVGLEWAWSGPGVGLEWLTRVAHSSGPATRVTSQQKNRILLKPKISSFFAHHGRCPILPEAPGAC